ncbi:hypothetical protein JAAARDRAFT_129926 [Jaapia argillacea MUCL 33604]|uniref:RMT2 domain-containing protein n=1 Tax=Jaapia argillacea MUCL 33604 TaxID=933084 RepID=A0A067PUI2_9AGAM|nr:hypothetical protein JAAARDRAFT_129926 [Jaapia argillacea MUCL 33604]
MTIDHDVETIVDLGAALIDAIFDRRPLPEIEAMVDGGAPLWFQDEDGTSCLHAAAYVEDAEFVKYLIAEGAVWNAVDNLQNTAGDIALSLNNETCYNIIRDAGIRSEMLLTLLASRSIEMPTDRSSLILKSTDTTAAGMLDAYLASPLKFTKDEHGQEICLLKIAGEEVGVMMGWERPIMQETVNNLCSKHPCVGEGLKVLNVGFGLGIIDTLFQSLPTTPALHVIIEPHPDVLEHMKETGWYEKKGVRILEGKWQDFVESDEILGIGGFDIVYTDTFSENYKDLHQFFGHLPDLLADSDSRFSFFNGLGATNTLFYDVYTHLAELHLSDLGLDVEWSDVDTAAAFGEDRWGKTREYFGMRLYRLPIGRTSIVG